MFSIDLIHDSEISYLQSQFAIASVVVSLVTYAVAIGLVLFVEMNKVRSYMKNHLSSDTLKEKVNLKRWETDLQTKIRDFGEASIFTGRWTSGNEETLSRMEVGWAVYGSEKTGERQKPPRMKKLRSQGLHLRSSITADYEMRPPADESFSLLCRNRSTGTWLN
mgnify:CR=1 FL=1